MVLCIGSDRLTTTSSRRSPPRQQTKPKPRRSGILSSDQLSWSTNKFPCENLNELFLSGGVYEKSSENRARNLVDAACATDNCECSEEKAARSASPDATCGDASTRANRDEFESSAERHFVEHGLARR